MWLKMGEFLTATAKGLRLYLGVARYYGGTITFFWKEPEVVWPGLSLRLLTL